MICFNPVGTPGTPEQIKQHTAQKERIINLFKRQLRVPHLGIEDTFREYMVSYKQSKKMTFTK